MRLVRVTALFCQGIGGHSVNYVTQMKTVTYNYATFVMAVIIFMESRYLICRQRWRSICAIATPSAPDGTPATTVRKTGY